MFLRAEVFCGPRQQVCPAAHTPQPLRPSRNARENQAPQPAQNPPGFIVKQKLLLRKNLRPGSCALLIQAGGDASRTSRMISRAFASSAGITRNHMIPGDCPSQRTPILFSRKQSCNNLASAPSSPLQIPTEAALGFHACVGAVCSTGSFPRAKADASIPTNGEASYMLLRSFFARAASEANVRTAYFGRGIPSSKTK